MAVYAIVRRRPGLGGDNRRGGWMLRWNGVAVYYADTHEEIVRAMDRHAARRYNRERFAGS